MKSIVFQLIILLLAVFLNSCQKEKKINPCDEFALLKPEEWAPHNFTFQIEDMGTVKLQWKQGIPVEGFQLERRTEEETWQLIAAAIDSSQRQLIDENVEVSTQYFYRISAFGCNLISSYAEANVVIGVIDIINPITGRTWMDRNLGASLAASNPTDTAAYGGLYQWGRGTDGHEKRNSETTTTRSSTDSPGHRYFIIGRQSDLPYDWRIEPNDQLWQGVNGINNPCPAGYRVPTEAEWDAERQTWNTYDEDGAIISALKLTYTGSRIWSGNFDRRPVGFYWTSTIDNWESSSRYLMYGKFGGELHQTVRLSGNAVRCIKD